MIGKVYHDKSLLNLSESWGMARRIFLEKQLDLPQRGIYTVSEAIVSKG